MINTDKLQKKLTAKRLRKETSNAIDMATNKQTQKDFNDEMVRKTWLYQKKYGFKMNPRKGHEFWNVEADAFKHAFGGAIMSFRYGNWGSTLGGIYHENQTKNNPHDEWNMDSWNNDQGRKIANEIKKEYSEDFYDKNPEMCEKIIAAKVMSKMRNGELITHPSDKRKFKGSLEGKVQRFKDAIDKIEPKGVTTGHAAPISNTQNSIPTTNNKTSIPPVKTASQLFSDEIRNKHKAKQIETNKRYANIFNRSQKSQLTGKGHWVTINGAHIFIED